jgi:hypothetical protein
LKHTDNKKYVVAKYTTAQAEEHVGSRIPVSREAAITMQLNTAAGDGIIFLPISDTLMTPTGGCT